MACFEMLVIKKRNAWNHNFSVYKVENDTKYVTDKTLHYNFLNPVGLVDWWQEGRTGA